jgi:hypothetical protein
MRLFVATVVSALAISTFGAAPVQAKGCLKGAAVGGVAGHVAGHHGVLGAAAGCAIGHHEASKNERTQQVQREHENAGPAEAPGRRG